MKQIGIGLSQYVQDYDERTPPYTEDIADYSNGSTSVAGSASASGNNWILAIQPYIKSWQVFRCPSARANNNTAALPGGYAPSGNSDSNYFHNGVTMDRNISIVPESASVIWVQENVARTSHALARPNVQVANADPLLVTYSNWKLDMTPGNMNNNFSNVHFDGGNLLYMDGHVKWKRQSAICANEYGLTSTSCASSTTSATPTSTATF